MIWKRWQLIDSRNHQYIFISISRSVLQEQCWNENQFVCDGRVRFNYSVISKGDVLCAGSPRRWTGRSANRRGRRVAVRRTAVGPVPRPLRPGQAVVPIRRGRRFRRSDAAVWNGSPALDLSYLSHATNYQNTYMLQKHKRF